MNGFEADRDSWIDRIERRGRVSTTILKTSDSFAHRGSIMRIDYVPALPELKRLYEMPRNSKRFFAYLRTMIDENGEELGFAPMVLANPMAREHVRELVDRYLEMNADSIALETIESVLPALSHFDERFDASLVIIDDQQGGWTNRFATEIYLRQIPDPRSLTGKRRARFWITGVLWSSEAASEEKVRFAMMSAALRLLYVFENGPARSVAELIGQERAVMCRLGQSLAPLGIDEDSWTRQILADRANEQDLASLVTCLFGDSAAESMGFEKLGLPENAGLRSASNGLSSAFEK